MTSHPPSPALKPPVAELSLFRSGHASHCLSSRVITAGGARYRLLLAAPRRPPPPQGFPALYMLDGAAAFDLMEAGHLALAEGVVLAGVAHDTDLRFDTSARLRDYTPPGGGPAPSGGADIFLRRLTGPIREAVEAEAPVDASRRTLFGHSLAGLFSLYTLFRQPGTFRRIAAVSPAIWWDDEIMLRLEEAMEDPQERHDILIALGDSERRSSPEGPHWKGPAPHTLELARRLEKRRTLSLSTAILPGLGHAATLAAALPLAFALAAKEHLKPAT